MCAVNVRCLAFEAQWSLSFLPIEEDSSEPCPPTTIFAMDIERDEKPILFKSSLHSLSHSLKREVRDSVVSKRPSIRWTRVKTAGRVDNVLGFCSRG